VRRFVKGDKSTVRLFAQRLIGSPDIYGYREREPGQSINFVTCHDGFTLNDLVSYNDKHNEANGEANQDGRDENLSWNCGIEGPSENPDIESLRRRQVKNFLVLVLISVGLPMLQMGDEMRRTQHGNNNAYCQDNDMSWLDWSLLNRHQDLHRFVRTLIGYRRRMMGASSEETLEPSLNELLRHARFDWHGVRLNKPDWADHSHSIACTIRSTPLDLPVWLHVMINAYWEALDFDLPPIPAATLAGWWRWIDTARESPEDIMDAVAAPLVHGTQYRVAPRSVAVLFARTADASALEESVSATPRTTNQIDTSVTQPG
jgi:glycogen operon protein